MNILGKIKVAAFYLSAILWAASCENGNVVDFGFDGSFSGTLKDPNGNIVPGNITSNSLVVKALGEHDQVTTDMRVQGDGTYQNTKLYPQKYKIWVSGPVTLETDTMTIDFAKEKSVKKDLIVTPFVSIAKPVAGNPANNEVEVSYVITPDGGKVVSKRELYCSTIPYPDSNTGTGPFLDTKEVTLATNEGSATITGLEPGTKYFIRIGAQATGASGFNYSEQIIITTP